MSQCNADRVKKCRCKKKAQGMVHLGVWITPEAKRAADQVAEFLGASLGEALGAVLVEAVKNKHRYRPGAEEVRNFILNHEDRKLVPPQEQTEGQGFKLMFWKKKA